MNWVLLDTMSGRGIKFPSYRHLINYISHYNKYSRDGVDNSIINRIGILKTDLYFDEELNRFIGKAYRIVCPAGYFIWDELIKHDILSKYFNKQLELERIAWERGLKTNKNTKYTKFRRETCQGIHKRKKYCTGVYRSVSTFNERRQTLNPEMLKYNRGSRGRLLPDGWDKERMRSIRPRSWKNQTKDRHQWEHRLGNKRVYQAEYKRR